MKHFFFSMLVGAPVVYLATVAITGGFDDAAGLIAISIICTAGIGLVFWIPLCWISGASILWIVRKIRGTDPEAESSQQTKPRADWFAMANYLQKVQTKGGSLDAAKERLRGAGWEETEIENALGLLTN